MHRGTQNCKKQGGPISTPTGPHPSLAPLGGAAEAARRGRRTATGYQRPVQRVGGMKVVINCIGEPRTDGPFSIPKCQVPPWAQALSIQTQYQYSKLYLLRKGGSIEGKWRPEMRMGGIACMG